MRILSSLVTLVTVGCGLALAQDPITANTANISVILKDAHNTACSFRASSVQYNVQQAVNIESQSSGIGAGKITFNPLTIVKPVDACSSLIFYQAAAGISFPEVLIVISPPAASAHQSTYVIRLGIAAAVSLNDAASQGKTIEEQVQFEYGDLTLAEVGPAPSYTVQSCHGWNRITNAPDTSHCNIASEIKQQ